MATTAPTVRSLDQILSELGTVYNPQVKNIQTRQSQLPGQIKAEEQGLAAKQESAFGDILNSARRRGTGVAFGGIPLGEQAKYSATEYMPALARLKQSGRDQAMSLEDAINSLRTEQRGVATTQQQYEQRRRDAFDTEQRSLAAKREAEDRAAAAAAAQTADLSKYFSQMNQQNQPVAPVQAPQSVLQNKNIDIKQDGGFNFFNDGGKPVTAGQFAQANNVDIRELLQEMGQTDAGAAEVYNQLRRVPEASLMSKINELAPKYQHIFGGYSLPQIFRPAASSQGRQPSINFNQPSNSSAGSLNMGGIRSIF